MTKEKEYFINLLSSYVNGTSPEGVSVDFEELYRLAEINDVSGIIANQLKLVPFEFQPQGQIRSYFNQLLGYAVMGDISRDAAYSFIDDFLNELKCRHVFVKGINVKNYYPDPSLRTSGDVDVIVDDGALESLHKAAQDKNIKIKNYVSHTLTLDLDGVEIEIHSQSDVVGHYFDDMFAICLPDENYRYRLTEYDELLYVMCHLAKHLAYRGAGVRMLLDVDLMTRGIKDFDEKRFLSLCDKAKILKTAQVILSFCKYLFNTPVAASVRLDDDIISKLENVFIDGGSFGFEINSVPLRYLNGGNNSKFKTLMKMAFPSKDYLKICYPYYKKHPSLLPVARANRLLDGAFKKRKRTKDVLSRSDSEAESSVQLDLAKELDIDKFI